MSLIDINNLYVHFAKIEGLLNFFSRKQEIVHAVDGISFKINKGETFGLVGESGCGKTTVGKSLLRLLPKNVIKGEIIFEDRDIYKFSDSELRKFRKHSQIIFQNAITSLNPRTKIGDIIAEPFKIHEREKSSAEIDREVVRLLELVSLSESDKHKYPAEISGGQGRRVGIARALSLNPKFIVCDEPTSGLDISIAAEIINLMNNLQKKLGLTFFWITHNLRAVSYASDRVAVMYLGKIVEMGETSEVFNNPLHRYTQALFSAVRTTERNEKIKKIVLKGEVPSPINIPSGCRFHTRCWDCKPVCKMQEPMLARVKTEHLVACHLAF